MTQNGHPKGPEKKEEPKLMSRNGLIAFGMFCGTLAWIVWVIWG